MSDNHGNTPAAWTTVTIVLVGFVVGGIGLMIYSWPTFWVGVALAPVGVVVGVVLARMGHGAEAQRSHMYSAEEMQAANRRSEESTAS